MTEQSRSQVLHSLWHGQRVKRLVRSRMGAGCLVSVRETPCPDPACPGPATEIRITSLSFREIRVTLHKPAAAVTGTDIAEVL
jgi:hypothetical protein